MTFDSTRLSGFCTSLGSGCDGVRDKNTCAGQEAVQMASHMAKEQGNVSIYSFGVGCGVDR